jgi:hypothetical protein
MAPVDDRPLFRLGTRWGIGDLYVFALDGSRALPWSADERSNGSAAQSAARLLRYPEIEPWRRYTTVCCRVSTVLSTIYEVETSDVQVTYRMLTKVGDTHVMPLSDAMQLSDRVGWFFEPITGATHAAGKAAEPVSPGEVSSE